MIKSAYQRGREAALQEFSQFLVDVAARSRQAAHKAARDFESSMPSERLGRFEQGVLTGIAVAHERLCEIVDSGQIPRLENILPAERDV